MNTTTKESFFETLRPYFSEEHLEDIYEAYGLAIGGHRYQERDSGERYFEHPRAVAEIIFEEFGLKNDSHVIIAALLHDLIEDSWLLTFRMIRKLFGSVVERYVRLLTKVAPHRPQIPEEKQEYNRKLHECGEWKVQLIKLADVLHNLRSLHACPDKKKKKFTDETELYHFELNNIFITLVPKKYLASAHWLEREIKEEVRKNREELEIKKP